MIARLEDWSPRLLAWLGEVRHRPFAAGRLDCGLFGAGAVLAQTGVDLAADWRGGYGTIRDGLRLLRRAGYADQIDVAARHLPEIDPATAQFGDLAALETPEGLALTVVQGATAVYAAGPDGMRIMPKGGATRAFRVG